MQKYRFIENLTSDVMFEAYGKTPRELFENSAFAVSSVICKIAEIKPKKSIIIKVSGENMEELLFSWLQEIIARVDIETMFFSKFKIKNITSNIVEAEISGQPVRKNLGETVVKAVTRHNFSIKKKNSIYTATVVLDI
jgi:SHS2 domain-containing protein